MKAPRLAALLVTSLAVTCLALPPVLAQAQEPKRPDVADLLKKLEARARKVVRDGTGMPVEVSVNNKPFADDDLALLKPFSGLRALDLTYTQVTDAGVRRIADAHPSLETLQLAGTKVTVACVKDLARLKALRRLELWHAALTDEMSGSCAAITCCTSGPGPPAGKPAGLRRRRRWIR